MLRRPSLTSLLIKPSVLSGSLHDWDFSPSIGGLYLMLQRCFLASCVLLVAAVALPFYAPAADKSNTRTGNATQPSYEMVQPQRETLDYGMWIEPLKDLGVTILTMRNTGGTDHEAFDGVGIPGFQFIQDPLDYGSRTHHSNMDTYERLQPEDLAQAAVVEAIFVYNAARRDQMLPRKPLPHPELGRAAQGASEEPHAVG